MLDVMWEWIEAFVRWLHVIAGIAWIGSSFFFIHLDLDLKKRQGLPEKAYGESWHVHGGGFYHMIKYLVAPDRLPDKLVWHKWEAYTTWVSGFALMVLVYYMSAELYMIDKRVFDLSTWQAIAISVGGLVLGWALYDAACRSPFGKNDLALALTGFLVLVLLAFLFGKIYSGRGAFMQMGALMGTIMAANVLMVIIPGQRKVIADLVAGKTPDPIHGERGKQRSTHNNYLTLPVLFVMIANHYPLAFGTRFSWAILGCLIIMGVFIRHFFNERHKGNPTPWWTWVVIVALGFLIVWLSTFRPLEPIVRRAAVPQSQAALTPEAQARQHLFKQVSGIIESRCSMCHAKEPVWSGINVPPKGVALETERDIILHARQIRSQSVWSHAMPPGNITEMTSEERATVEMWLKTVR
jgi:uncharacterized membrane protein